MDEGAGKQNWEPRLKFRERLEERKLQIVWEVKMKSYEQVTK